MALINRMSRLFTADFHAVLDRMEEPESLLKQAIREMDEELARSEHAVKLLEHERETLTGRRRKVDAAVTELAAQLDVCFADGDEALARKTVRRKLEAEKLGKHLDERCAGVDKQLAERRAVAAEQREHLDAMRQKAEIFADAPLASADPSAACAVGDDEVEVAFLRERRARRPS